VTTASRQRPTGGLASRSRCPRSGSGTGAWCAPRYASTLGQWHHLHPSRQRRHRRPSYDVEASPPQGDSACSAAEPPAASPSAPARHHVQAHAPVMREGAAVMGLPKVLPPECRSTSLPTSSSPRIWSLFTCSIFSRVGKWEAC
jgi:hypothetical protein